MAKAPKQTEVKLDPKITAITDWYEANKAKNAAASKETKAKNKLQVELANATEPFEFAISNSLTLKAGEFTEEEYYIDPKKLLELYPDEFWELVSIAKTNAVAVIGEKGVTKCSKSRKVTKFAIKKDKNTDA